MAAAAAQAAAHLTRHQAITVAQAEPQAASLQLKNPGSHWDAHSIEGRFSPVSMTMRSAPAI